MTTKLFALATAALVATASFATADTSRFEYQRSVAGSNIIDLGTVVAEGNGVVELYNFQGRQVGELLGTTSVNAGANTDVKINTGVRPTSPVIAVLKVDGQEVATRDYFLER